MRITANLLLLLLTFALNAQKKDAFLPQNLKLDWQLVQNNYQGKDQYLTYLTITNGNKKAALPPTGWVIYYNQNRDVLETRNGASPQLLQSSRINGDLFYLRPTWNFKGLKAGESLKLELICDGWAFNISDAPAGFYLVWDAKPDQGHNISQITFRQPTDINQFKRAPDQKNDQVTPDMVFEQNRLIRDIPEAQLPRIFPTPMQYKESDGAFLLSAATVIAADPAFSNEARYLAEECSMFLGTTLKTGTSSDNSIRMRLDPSLGDEAYRISVSASGINLAAAKPAGMFYAIQSLKCLIPLEAWKGPLAVLAIPHAEVNDAPRFAYRGLHIDVARNFQQKEQVQRILNWMALYKLNVLHFHFTEDEAWRIEIAALPELTSVGAVRGHTLDSKTHMPATYGSGGDTNNPQSGHYSRKDYIDILQYAKARHIEVIPEIETPGHARAAIKAMNARYERLMKENKPQEAARYLLADPNDQSVYRSAQNFNDNVMCVAQPSVYNFIETVVDALIEMHNTAGMPLKTIHMGGDEVPQGVWEKSPLCQDLLKTLPANEYRSTSDLWLYYWRKVNDIVAKRGLYVSGWEEIGMRESKVDGQRVMMVNPAFANNNFHTYVWNTVVGWGAEDLPYRLANGGYKVVLCPVTNLYFDLAYQKDFDEPGYYWGGFLDVDKPFYFIPYDYLKNTKVDRFGNPFDPALLVGKDRLTDYGKTNILGIQGELWSENIHTAAEQEYLAFPKMLGLAERAWATDPTWATEKDPKKSEQLYQTAWSVFTNMLGKRELTRLNYYQGGANFRIPTAGAKRVGSTVQANVQLPGLTIRYTTDGSEPTISSPVYTKPIEAAGKVRLRVFDSKGRGGRTVEY